MEQTTHGHMGKHGLIMLLCCLIPLVVLVAIQVFNVSLSSIGFFFIILLCPLMHILMMRGMSHDRSGGESSCHEAPSEATAKEALPASTVEQ